MTANVLREATDACLAAGMDGFIPKPSDRAQIVAMLAQWLRVAGVAAPDPRSPTPAPGGDAIDLATYRRVEDAMGAEMALLVAEFTSSTEHLIRDIVAAALQQDAQTVKFRAHTLRSSSASVGALDLSRLAADLEAGVSAAQFADWPAVAPTLQAEFARVVPALQRLARVPSVDLPDAQTPPNGEALPAPSNRGTAAAVERARIAS